MTRRHHHRLTTHRHSSDLCLVSTTTPAATLTFLYNITIINNMTGTETAAAAAASQNEIADVLQERLIDSEYKIWKKNTPYLYVVSMFSLVGRVCEFVKIDTSHKHFLLLS